MWKAAPHVAGFSNVTLHCVTSLSHLVNFKEVRQEIELSMSALLRIRFYDVSGHGSILHAKVLVATHHATDLRGLAHPIVCVLD